MRTWEVNQWAQEVEYQLSRGAPLCEVDVATREPALANMRHYWNDIRHYAVRNALRCQQEGVYINHASAKAWAFIAEWADYRLTGYGG